MFFILDKIWRQYPPKIEFEAEWGIWELEDKEYDLVVVWEL